MSKSKPYVPREFVLDDLDRHILFVLPDEGAKLSLHLNDALKAAEIRRKLADPMVSTGKIGSSLNLMKKHGYVVNARPAKATTHGWQRTAKGKAEARQFTIPTDQKETK